MKRKREDADNEDDDVSCRSNSPPSPSPSPSPSPTLLLANKNWNIAGSTISDDMINAPSSLWDSVAGRLGNTHLESDTESACGEQPETQVGTTEEAFHATNEHSKDIEESEQNAQSENVDEPKRALFSRKPVEQPDISKRPRIRFVAVDSRFPLGPKPREQLHKRGKSPPPASQRGHITKQDQDPLTWQDDEITGHDPSDPEDDGYGINGIGFKPTAAIAWGRIQKRKKQIANWRSREAREARELRKQRREGMPVNMNLPDSPSKRKKVKFEERKTRMQ